MKKRLFIFGGFVAVAFIAGALILSRQSPARSLPVYQGKNSQQWLALTWSTNQGAVIGAFRAMGTNAEPFLVNEFRARDSVLNDVYIKTYPKLPGWCRQRLVPPMRATEKWNAASLILLNSTRKDPLFYDLKPILADKNNQSHGCVLSVIQNWAAPQDADWVPILLDCLNEKDVTVQMEAAYTLSNIGHPAKAAVPGLTSALASPNEFVRGNAALALWRITDQTNSASTLVNTIRNSTSAEAKREAAFHLYQMNFKDPSLIPDYVQMIQAASSEWEIDGPITALSRYYNFASNAVPVLVQKLDGCSYQTRQTILRALSDIDPETAAKYSKR